MGTTAEKMYRARLSYDVARELVARASWLTREGDTIVGDYRGIRRAIHVVEARGMLPETRGAAARCRWLVRQLQRALDDGDDAPGADDAPFYPGEH